MNSEKDSPHALKSEVADDCDTFYGKLFPKDIESALINDVQRWDVRKQSTISVISDVNE